MQIARRSRVGATLLLVLAGCDRAAPPPTPGVADVADWAYPTSVPAAAPAPDAVTPLALPGSAARFTAAQLKNLFAVPDWRPEQHPAMPPIVAQGRKPEVRACGFCHQPTGNGRPENAALAGLPRDYIVAQLKAFRDGSRASTVTGRGPYELMIQSAKALTDAEITAAAEYFAPLRRTSFVRVVERGTIPKAMVAGWIYAPDPAGGREPLGRRIIEMPTDAARFERRDPDSGYIAYVPPGSIATGAALAAKWGPGGQFACATCHGARFEGVGTVPPLAGKSPTYLVRQLNDFRSGAHHGADAAPMAAVAKDMQPDDMIALAAFIASRPLR